jgi:hypothetical protein
VTDVAFGATGTGRRVQRPIGGVRRSERHVHRKSPL